MLDASTVVCGNGVSVGVVVGGIVGGIDVAGMGELVATSAFVGNSFGVVCLAVQATRIVTVRKVNRLRLM